MSNMSLSSSMTSAIETVLSNASVTEFTLDVQVTNTDNSSYSFSPLWVDHISIVQSFAENFADQIVLDFPASPKDYMNMYANSKTLQVNLRFVYYNSQRSERVFSPPPIALSYKAMMINPVDLSKKYATGSMIPTDSMPETEQHVGLQIPVKLYLIENTAYVIRQQKFHGIYQKATVSDVISHIVQSFSIKTLYMVKPDNTMKWDHIVIPPAYGIDEIFDYMQVTYGIYMKGIDWYYTNSTLYIYPAYENNPSIRYNADIYNAPPDNYIGLMSFHQSDPSGTRIAIVCTAEPQTQDISTRTAENKGTGFSFIKAASMIDNFVSNLSSGTMVKANNSLSVNSAVDRTTSQGANNPKYTKTTDNIFDQSSQLAKDSATLIRCGWNNAVPFLLYPGHNIRYNFDKNSVFTTQQGMLERVIYDFSRKRILSQGSTYAGSAQLAIRADSDISNTPQTDLFSS